MTNIKSMSFELEPREGDNRDRPPQKKVKMIITMKRDPDFFTKVDTDALWLKDRIKWAIIFLLFNR